jgi:hypothetical protein
MRFTQFRPLTEADLKRLDELRMSPSALQKFASSPAAQGIMAGFEAELVFIGLGGDADDEMEADYDVDERAYSIEQVIEFFEHDDWGYGLNDRQATRLREALDETYYEWYDEQMQEAFRDEAEDLIKRIIEEDDFDWDDEVRKQLDMMGLSKSEIEEAMTQGKAAPRFTRLKDQEEYALANPGYQRYQEAYEQAEGLIDDLVQDSISSQDRNYDAALDDFRDNFQIDDDSSFFNDVGLRYMSDIAESYSLDWPYYTGGGGQDGGFDESNAERLADDLHEKLGVRTKVSSGYHSAKRDAVTWIFEPDSSLDANEPEDMPVEIVSPPMPLEECLRQLENFFAWAEDNGAYANSSTGFHMGVSLPYRGGDVDYVKLALFLGDEYVLNQFGRAANHFTEAAMKKIRQRVKSGSSDVAGAMELMRNNLLELAQRSIASNDGFGKYTSINPQNKKYIEFRSAGGSNYFRDIDKLKNTLLRYAQAMAVAGDPAAERQEYYKKLYKLIAPQGDSGLDLFAKFTAGAISATELKQQWAEKALAKDAPEFDAKGDWVVIDQGTGRPVVGQEYNGYRKSEVRARAKAKLSPASSDTDFDMGYDIKPMYTGKWEVYTKDDAGNETTLEIVDAGRRGEAVDQVYDKYNDQNIPFFVRAWYQDYQPQPEPKLTRRAELAKRIKQPNSSKKSTYEIVDRRTNRVVLQYNASSEDDAGNKYSNWLSNQGMPADTENYGYRSAQATNNVPSAGPAVTQQSQVRDIPIAVDQSNQRPAQWNDTTSRQDIEFYMADNPGQVFHTMQNASYNDMMNFIQQQERDGMPPGFLRVRQAS